jgi:ring-1,2-phenylacetyl-CoA epoxidase subunit PaaE
MAFTFHPLTVKKIQPETAGCVSIWLDVPEQLHPLFTYKPGQHLTLRTTIDGQEVRRTYSLCSSPLSGQWRIAVKQVPQGVFSHYAATRLQPGDVLEVLPPGGRFFTEPNATHTKNYMAFAAGSGITPILSIIETTLLTEPASRFTLVYGNRARNSILFREELEALKNRFLNRLVLQYTFSREQGDVPLQQGRIDAEKCRLIFQRIVPLASIDAFFLCGPQEMIFSVKSFLDQQGIEENKIHFELFTANKPAKPLVPLQVATMSDTDRLSTVTITLDGHTSSFILAKDGESILDAALAQGANLPYACKGGVCCTCKARLAAGQVEMDVNYALTQVELAQGFVLTCQSHPVSETVAVDFDAI